ncbi:hypothetical protein [Saccharicrinis sp. FJH54]|uniref:hypothetical protein n=1 Tax=Saccharicrinis sp. FJH54 TaxID=3344665 RepID=UPI0035D52A61
MLIKRISVPVLVLYFIFYILTGCSKDETTVKGDDRDTTGQNTALPHTIWSLYSNNPVISTSGEPDEWDGLLVDAPTIVNFKDTLRMWYEGSTSAPFDGTINIGYAWSTDGMKWDKLPHPVLKARPDGWAYPHLACPIVIIDEDTLKMWIGGGTVTSTGMMIGYATSNNGINWKWKDNPVITGNFDWNKDGVLPGPVIKEDGLYKMWFIGGVGPYAFPTTNTMWQTGYATSLNGIQWSVRKEPVFKVGESFDKSTAVCGSVIKIKDTYEMWYSGSTMLTGGYPIAKIGYATSEDGIRWQRYSHNPVISRSKNSTGLFSPRVLIDHNKFVMWFSAWHPGPSINYAVATN